MNRRPNALRINAADNVAVALSNIAAGAGVVLAGEDGPVAREAIPFAHKVALDPIARGAAIRKYGVEIAFATLDVAAGDWVHQQNAKSYFMARREAREQ
jgi:hypothetical protein